MKKEFYVTVDDGTTLFVRTSGQGQPVLLIHGSMVDADFFQDCAAMLSKFYQVITYDRRGYSRSAFHSDCSITRQVRDAEQILQATCNKPAVVVGCSAGGLIALQLAAKQTPLVCHTIVHEPPLICTTALTDKEAEWLEAVKKHLSRGKIDRAIREFLGIMGAPDPRGKPLSEGRLLRQWENGFIFIKHEFLEQFSLSSETIGLERLVGSSKLVVTAGDSGGETYCFRATKALAEQLRLPCIYFPGGHNAASELPTEFALMLSGIISFEV